MSSESGDLLPIVPSLTRDANGEPGLQGVKCGSCGQVFLGERKVCASCGARDQMQPVTLGKTGKLYNYTIVHRSFPGVKTPFVSAIVDLDGGGVVKGNLVAAEEDLAFDMPVKMVFDKADRTDAKGREYLTYYFIQA